MCSTMLCVGWWLFAGYLMISVDNRVIFALATSVPSSEVDALHAIYDAAHGDDWIWAGVPWNFTESDPDPCSENWQGIQCELICNNTVCADDIVSITLSIMNLVGTIADEIGDFPALVNLTVSYNHLLTGRIPDSVGNLTHLHRLDLSYNLLNGSIPALPNSLTFLMLDANVLTGSIPSFIYSFSNLTWLTLSENLLNGTISSDVGSLSLLSYLDFAGNGLTGSIPPSIGNLSALVGLQLGYNMLMNGSIPAEIGELTSLQDLFLAGMNLHGCIPDELFNLHSLLELDLSNNYLIGRISSSFSNLSLVSVLHLSENEFEGPLTWIGSMTSLTQLHADHNHFTGTIPSSVGGLVSLNRISFSFNGLWGSLPDEIFQLPQLHGIELENNLLEGSISPSISKMTYLESCMLNNNIFGGTFPHGLSNITHLVEFNINHNQIFGQIPSDLASTTSANTSVLSELSLGDNLFTGTIPFSVSSLPELVTLELQGNAFHGDLGFLPSSSDALNYVNISDNIFTGVIDGFSSFQSMEVLDLSYNILSGTIPSFANWTLLEYFLVQHNVLSGTLDGMLESDVNVLQIVDVSFNRLTGSLPRVFVSSHAFQNLSSFAAVSNCFTGTIPGGFCSISSLTALALDGLSTASRCRKATIPFVQSYTLPDNAVHATIPGCLFTMAMLTTLHLSGNGLYGTIPVGSAIGEMLSDLSLSHNKLTGTIPTALQGGSRWTNLDLSFNKLTGSLLDDVEGYLANSSISLDINRLSGRIPGIYFSVSDVDLLRGNLFTCDRYGTGADVPDGDPYRDQYECGSETINTAYGLWLAMVAAIGVVFLALHLQSKKALASLESRDENVAVSLRKVSRWRSLFLGQEAINFHFADNCVVSTALLQNIYNCGALLYELRATSCLVALFLLFIALPVFVSLSAYYGSYLHQYSWAISAAYLTGQSAAIGLLVLFLAFAAYVWGIIERARARAVDSIISDKELAEEPTNSVAVDFLIAKYILATLLNTTVVMIANGSYVYLFAAVDQPFAVFLSLLLALFKLGWVAVMKFLTITYLQPAGSSLISTSNVLFHSSITLFNTIVVPCLATMVVDFNCFYFVFVTPPLVSSSYQYVGGSTECESTPGFSCSNAVGGQVDSSYQPPFSYSYQCSSALLSAYAYVFVFKYILIGLISPCCVLAASLYTDQRYEQQKDIHPLIFAVLPPLWNVNRRAGQKHKIGHRFHWILQWVETSMFTICGSMSSCVFSSADFAVRLAMMIGTLLTFGAVLPFLALIVCVSICSNTFVTQLGLARLLETSAADEKMKSVIEAVCVQCKELFHALHQATLPLLPLLVLFCACFIFDTAGDQDGALHGFYFMLIMLAVPLLGFILVRMWMKREDDSADVPKHPQASVEL